MKSIVIQGFIEVQLTEFSHDMAKVSVPVVERQTLAQAGRQSVLIAVDVQQADRLQNWILEIDHWSI